MTGQCGARSERASASDGLQFARNDFAVAMAEKLRSSIDRAWRGTGWLAGPGLSCIKWSPGVRVWREYVDIIRSDPWKFSVG